MSNSSYFQNLQVGLSSDDDGHGVLKDLDQGTARANEKLGHPDREYLQSVALPRNRLKGSRKKGGRKSKGQGFRVIVTVGRRVFVSLHIGGPVPGEIILIKVPAAQNELLFGTRGGKYSGLSQLSPGGSLCR